MQYPDITLLIDEGNDPVWNFLYIGLPEFTVFEGIPFIIIALTRN